MSRILMLLCILFFNVGVLFSIAHANEPLDIVRQFLAKSRGPLLPESTWPLDQGDSARTKMSINSGFPKNITAEDIEYISNDNLTGIVFLYTAGKDNEWIYSIRGDGETGFFVNKLRFFEIFIILCFNFSLLFHNAERIHLK
jgi:hypothetical protein